MVVTWIKKIFTDFIASYLVSSTEWYLFGTLHHCIRFPQNLSRLVEIRACASRANGEGSQWCYRTVSTGNVYISRERVGTGPYDHIFVSAVLGKKSGSVFSIVRNTLSNIRKVLIRHLEKQIIIYIVFSTWRLQMFECGNRESRRDCQSAHTPVTICSW